MAIEIKTVCSRKDLKTFVRFANRMYKGNKFYVPSMPLDDLKTLDKNYNAAFEFCEAEYFLAYKDGKVVGRVAAILNKKANQAWNVNQAFQEVFRTIPLLFLCFSLNHHLFIYYSIVISKCKSCGIISASLQILTA